MIMIYQKIFTKDNKFEKFIYLICIIIKTNLKLILIIGLFKKTKSIKFIFKLTVTFNIINVSYNLHSSFNITT